MFMLYQRSELNDIKITDVRWKDCEDKNALFLSSMDPERVLAGFKRTCRIKTDAKPYGGWENSLIAGHGTGHYFSALGMRIATLRGRENTSELEESIAKANAVVTGLKECQEKLGNGFLSAATVQDEDNPYIQFDVLEGKAEGQQWVPWYALHKVLQGIMDLWTYGHIAGAKEAALALADWVCDRVLSWDKETRKKVLSVEYGGMNDSLYQLYTLTGDKRYLSAAEVFDEPELYEELLSFKNRMRGVHANATIPKILGYLEGAKAFDKAGIKEEVQPRITTAEKFWDAVIRNQTYATGGIGDMEHFFADGLLDGSRTQCNAESCCCYNMMKLSQLLFELTGKPKYLDYIERTLWNAKLGSVGPDGGYTYFNPMATGYYRLYSPSKPSENPFWCCVGTALEDFASIGGKICYRKDPDLYITQWISSDIRFGEQEYQLRADYGKGRLTISCVQCNAGTTRVKLRIPRWIKNRDLILPDSEEFLDVAFPPDGTFELGFEMQLKITGLPDEASAKGFMYGPFVLCVPLGNDKWGINENAGIEVVAPAWKVVFDASVKCNINYGKTQRAVLDREYLTLPEGVALQAFSDNLEKYLVKDNDRFLLTGLKDFRGGDISLPLIPYYQAGNERYGIYWYIRSNQDLA
ncbi:MAG: glycoside hydrolase family 127 protein [Clostridiales bacterium]|nr:glycoside hydrolase family 127 protein [Clostridiales bacterium]